MTVTVVNIRRVNGITPAYDVYIGRAIPRQRLKGSKWANPFLEDIPDRPGKPGKKRAGTREVVIAKYHAYLLGNAELLAALPELRGKVLGCWCKPEACHGDVLATLADAVEVLRLVRGTSA
jgi:hypothetical protein